MFLFSTPSLFRLSWLKRMCRQSLACLNLESDHAPQRDAAGGDSGATMPHKRVTAAGPRRAGVVVLLLVATARNVSAELLRLVTICNASVRSYVQTLTDFRADARRC